jgi:hypothetical protein
LPAELKGHSAGQTEPTLPVVCRSFCTDLLITALALILSNSYTGTMFVGVLASAKEEGKRRAIGEADKEKDETDDVEEHMPAEKDCILTGNFGRKIMG